MEGVGTKKQAELELIEMENGVWEEETAEVTRTCQGSKYSEALEEFQYPSHTSF